MTKNDSWTVSFCIWYQPKLYLKECLDQTSNLVSFHPSLCSKLSKLRMKHHIPLFKWNDCMLQWQRVDGWRQMKRRWPRCSFAWRDHERGALARENCAIKRLLGLMYFPLALWSTIIECSKREAQPTGFAWRCHKTAFTARFEFKCNCRLVLLIGQSKTSSTKVDHLIVVKL